MSKKKDNSFTRVLKKLEKELPKYKKKSTRTKKEQKKLVKRLRKVSVKGDPILKKVPGFKAESGKTEAFLQESWASYEQALLDPASPLWRPESAHIRLHEVKVHHSSMDDTYLLGCKVWLSCRVEGAPDKVLFDLSQLANEEANSEFTGRSEICDGLHLIHWEAIGFWRKVLRRYYYQWETVKFPDPSWTRKKSNAVETYGIALARALCFAGLRAVMDHLPMPCASGNNLSVKKPSIMGILNVTADSFSDGGKYNVLDAAVARALQMVSEGAGTLDLGAESTRPGAKGISVAEQKRRLLPIVKALRKKRALKNIPLSIDTQSSEVARACLEEGADIINDVSALRKDKKMAKVVAKAGCPLILMHMKGTPRSMQKNPTYKDLMTEIDLFFRERIQAAFDDGIDPTQILLDPGFGFGKTLEHNCELMARLEEFLALGRPLVVGVSRKSMLGSLSGEKRADQRCIESVAAGVVALQNGATILRVHDVAEHVKALKVATAFL